MFKLDKEKLKKAYQDNNKLINTLMPETGLKREIMQESIDFNMRKIEELNGKETIEEIFAKDGVKTAEVVFNHNTNEEEFYIIVPSC